MFTLTIYVNFCITVALGVLYIVDCSVTDAHSKVVVQFVRIALMFAIIGNNIPKKIDPTI